MFWGTFSALMFSVLQTTSSCLLPTRTHLSLQTSWTRWSGLLCTKYLCLLIIFGHMTEKFRAASHPRSHTFIVCHPSKGDISWQRLARHDIHSRINCFLTMIFATQSYSLLVSFGCCGASQLGHFSKQHYRSFLCARNCAMCRVEWCIKQTPGTILWYKYTMDPHWISSKQKSHSY